MKPTVSSKMMLRPHGRRDGWAVTSRVAKSLSRPSSEELPDRALMTEVLPN